MADERDNEIEGLYRAENPEVFSGRVDDLIAKMKLSVDRGGDLSSWQGRDFLTTAACLRLADVGYENSNTSNQDFLETFYGLMGKQKDTKDAFRVVSLLLNFVIGLPYDDSLGKKPGEAKGKDMSEKLQSFCLETIERRLVEVKNRPDELKQAAYDIGSVLMRANPDTSAWGYAEINLPKSLESKIKRIMTRPELAVGHGKVVAEKIGKVDEALKQEEEG